MDSNQSLKQQKGCVC